MSNTIWWRKAASEQFRLGNAAVMKSSATAEVSATIVLYCPSIRDLKLEGAAGGRGDIREGGI